MFRPSKTAISFGAAALAVAALLLAAPKTAHALAATLVQVTNTAANPVINQDRDNEARNYYSASDSCNQVTSEYCQITFPAPPAGFRLIVNHVSILSLLPPGESVTSIDLRYLNGPIINFLPLMLYPATSPSYNYVTDQPVFAKFDAGESPQVITFVNSNTNFQMVAIISGYMVTIP